jgi:hypothetical protein
LIEVLEVSHPGGSGRTAAADQQQRGAVEAGIGHTGERIDEGHATGNGANTGPAAQAAEGVGQIRARLLVAYIYQTQAGLARGIQQRVQTMATQRRNPFDAVLAKTPH